MVGFCLAQIKPSADGKSSEALLDFPRMLPGHEGAARLLAEKAIETLENKAVSRVYGRVTTMIPADIRLAEDLGFTLTGWGYKVYYAYEMACGKLPGSTDAAQEINPEVELDECAGLAARWYSRSPEWCLANLKEWHAAGIITHLGMRQGGKLVAACLAASNEICPSTAAIYYIYTPAEACLPAMLARAVNACVDYGTHNLIADLVNEHRQYENTYETLGFKKVADWARCEMTLPRDTTPISR